MMKGRNDHEKNKVWIPISSMDDIERYQKSLISVLDKVEIDDCNPEFREDLATVYRLLSILISAGEPPCQEKIKNEKVLSNSLQKMMA